MSGRGVLLPVVMLACFVAGVGAGSALTIGIDGKLAAGKLVAEWHDSASWTAGTSVPPRLAAGPAPTGSPTRVRIPAIGVDTALEALHLDGSGTLAAPHDFGKAGWYADGTLPGDTGPAVVAGHVDSKRGPAVFFRLPQLRPGDLIEVERGGRWLPFRVVSSGWYPKTDFPTAAVYGPTPTPQLRLVTCGGEFDRSLHSYTDNLVVYAVRA
ncbi:MAG TPA: class F sortase [Micromonosporaceae bacterium]